MPHKAWTQEERIARWLDRLVLGAAAVFVVGLCFIWALLTSSQANFEDAADRMERFSVAEREILLFDERLTAWARLHAVTGEARWVADYDVVAQKLDGRIAEVIAIAPHATFGAAPAELKQANDVLVSLETEAGSLVANGKLARAQAVMFGAEYAGWKAKYSEALHRIIQSAENDLAASRARNKVIAQNTAVAVLTMVLFAAVIGALLVFVARKHAAILRSTREELQKERDVLDWRVKMRTADLAAAVEKAEAATAAKSAFLATMTHELRTPLNAVIGYAEIIEEEIVAGEMPSQEDAHRIRSAGRHLLGLISQILDVSKIEAGQMELHVTEVDAAAVARDVVEAARPLAVSNRNVLGLSVVGDVGVLQTDEVKLRQCLFNLIGNACKFTQDGRVIVTLEASADALAFRVLDTGIGMDAAQVAKLFQPFVQADSAITRRFGGAGLGLSITRGLAEAMGGSVSVESALGQGSTFILTMPREARQMGRPIVGSGPQDVQVAA